MTKKKTTKKRVKHRPGTLERRAYKAKVRKSPEWAELRQKKYEEQNGIDPVTYRPLLRGYNVHHLSQEWTEYGNLDSDRFIALNHRSHELIHALYDIFHREQNWDFLEEIKDIINKMEKYTEDDRARLKERAEQAGRFTDE